MKYVVVRHEEQMTEDAYVLNEGTAYVPLFSERDLVLFQDENETRYARVQLHLLIRVLQKDRIVPGQHLLAVL